MPEANVDVLSVHEHHVLVVKSAALAGLVLRGIAEPQVVGGLAEGQLDELLVPKVTVDLHGEVLVGEALDFVHDSVEHLATRAPAAGAPRGPRRP